jgi:hypothetical protein
MYFIKLIITAVIIELMSCFAPQGEDQGSSAVKIIEIETNDKAQVITADEKTKGPGELTIEISIP